MMDEWCRVANGQPCIILYRNRDYMGYGALLTVGSYVLSDLTASGISGVESLRLCNGASATLYQRDGLSGAGIRVSDDVNWLSSPPYQLGSIRVDACTKASLREQPQMIHQT